MQNFSFCHSWLFRKVTKAKAGQRKKIWNKLNFKKKFSKSLLGLFLMKDITAPFPKCVLENSLNPDFPSLEATYFACTIFKIQKYGGENHPVQPFQEEFFFFLAEQNSMFGTFATRLSVWNIQLVAPGSCGRHKVLLRTRYSHFSALWRWATPWAPSVTLLQHLEKERRKNLVLCNDAQAQHIGGARTYIRAREEILSADGFHWVRKNLNPQQLKSTIFLIQRGKKLSFSHFSQWNFAGKEYRNSSKCVENVLCDFLFF